MSSLCLLKEIPFGRAHSCEVGLVEHTPNKPSAGMDHKSEANSDSKLRSIVFTFKFGFPIIVQVVLLLLSIRESNYRP